MSDRHEVDSAIVLPGGMELVVPPPPAPITPAATADRGEPERDPQARRADAAREARRRPDAA